MSLRRTYLLSASLMLLLVAGCSTPASPSTAPSVLPTATPVVSPTVAPTDTATPAPSEEVVAVDDIDVEVLVNALIDGGWFGEREDQEVEATESRPAYTLTKIFSTNEDSTAVIGFSHDDSGLIRVTVYDTDGFASQGSQFDLGVISGTLLRQELGGEAATWLTEQINAFSADGEPLEATKTFGPDDVAIDFGTDPEFPGDAFVFFEPAQ